MDITRFERHIARVGILKVLSRQLVTSSNTLRWLRRLGIVVAVLSVGLLLVGCPDSSGETVDPEDLIGTWRVITSGVTLTFESGSEGQVYVVRDPQGYYGYLLEAGSDLLVQGYWFVSGAALYLEDEAGPVACPATEDRFVIVMNSEKTILTLDHLGDECQNRATILADQVWRRLDSNGS